MDEGVQRAGRVFHGWKLVVALDVILFFAAGGGLYVFPVFIGSLQAEFGWSMTEISSSAALFALVMGFGNPLVGYCFMRFGARKTMLAAAGLDAVVCLAYAALASLPMLYAIALFSGLAVAGTTILPAQTLVTNWFRLYRGRAMGITMLGIGAGGFLLPPLNEFLIRVIGWRMAWVFAASILVVVVIPLIALFVRTAPADLGLRVDGEPDEADGASGSDAPVAGLDLRTAAGTLSFWLLLGVYLAQLIGVSALNFHFVPFATQEIGFDSTVAARYYGLTVGFSIIGRLLFGWLADRWSPSVLLALSFVLLAVGPLVMEIAFLQMGLHRSSFLLLYALPWGMGVGANAVTMPVLVGRCFGELYFPRIMGVLMSGFALGIVIGIPGAGMIFDRSGSYETVLIGAALGLVVSALISLTIRPDRHRARFETGPPLALAASESA